MFLNFRYNYSITIYSLFGILSSVQFIFFSQLHPEFTSPWAQGSLVVLPCLCGTFTGTSASSKSRKTCCRCEWLHVDP